MARVTVLLPVYNDETRIEAAVRSILDQRGCDLELLVIDDASTDGTAARLAGIVDPRLRVHHNEINLHRSRSLNAAIDDVETEFVARMDADDVSLPDRLVRQIELLDARPDIAICGTWIKTTGAVPGKVWRLPTDPDEVAARLLFRSVLAHPTVMMRTDALRANALRYQEGQIWSEDWDLWQRASGHLRLTNVPEVLLLYETTTPADVSPTGPDPSRRRELLEIIDGGLKRLGVAHDDDEVELHRRLGSHDLEPTEAFVDAAERWLLKLAEANEVTGRFATPTFSLVLAEHWFYACHALIPRGSQPIFRFRRSPLAAAAELGSARWAKLLARIALRRPI